MKRKKYDLPQDSNGKWNHTEIYKFLKNQYWPSGIHNFRYVVLDVKSEQGKSRPNSFSYATSILLLLIGMVSLFCYSWLRNKKIAR